MSLLQFENIHFVPSIHQRMVFADEVLAAVDRLQPDCIAVELPPSLGPWVTRGVLQLPSVSAVCFPSPDAEGELIYVPIDPCDSIVEGVRSALEREIGLEFLDTQPAPWRDTPADLPDDLTVERSGLEAYVRIVLPYLRPDGPSVSAERKRNVERENAMADRLTSIAPRYKRILCILGIAHFEPVRRRLESNWENPPPQREEVDPIDAPFLAGMNPKSLQEFFKEIPHLAYQREKERGEKAPKRFDKLDSLRRTLKLAERKYRDRHEIGINLTQFKALYQYTRNLSILGGRLQPNTYRLVIGSTGAVDGDYGYEVYELARSYPFQSSESSLPELTLRDRRGSFADREERYVMLRLAGEEEMETVKLHFRMRPTRKLKEGWQKEWLGQDHHGICSWPPEDERQEKFMMFLRKRALEVIGSDKKQVVEFSTSLLDGLDIRETTRNWHTKKLFVQQTPQPQGKVAAVVVIFDDSAMDPKYPWRTTLYAENQNESDIAFYATPLGGKVVGPRISRVEFGGIMSIYPARQIPDIWTFPGIEDLQTCAQVLLAAAILFSEEKFIAYVDRNPPTSVLKTLAGRFKKQIVYLPSRGFPGRQLKKIRNFHILGDREVRKHAADYIFDD